MLIHILPQTTIIPVATTNRYHSLVGGQCIIVVNTSTSTLQTLAIGTTSDIIIKHSNSVYVESYDEETGIYYGISIYYGFNLSGPGLAAISVGNEVRIVGTVQYYEAGGTYQVAGLSYRQMKPDDPNNVQKLSEGHEPAFVPTTAETFVNGIVEVETEEGTKAVPYAQATMNTSISMENLKVLSVHTTTNEDSSSYGAMTLNCEADGIPVSVRTMVLTDANGNLITEEAFTGKTIDVKGVVDAFDGQYQIKVFSIRDITIK